MKKQNMIFRQGDVLLRRIDSMPGSAKEVEPENGKIVLALGEATGHSHSIEVIDCEAREFTFADAGTAVRRFLKVIGEATVRHEEHAPIALPPGLYEIVQQREYSPEEIRNVAD